MCVNEIYFYLYNIVPQLLVAVPLVTALCDLGYTIYQGREGEDGGVAQYLYLSSSTLAVTMASVHTHKHTLMVASQLGISMCAQEIKIRGSSNHVMKLQPIVLLHVHVHVHNYYMHIMHITHIT